MSRNITSNEERALELLGSGISPAQVASALGVTESHISQLLSNEEFASKVSQLRYEALSKHNLRDAEYDSTEDALLDKLKNSIPLMTRPMEIVRALTAVNSAKRRGQAAPEQIHGKVEITQVVLPAVLINKFIVNNKNQVVSIGERDLLTIQSGTLLKEVNAAQGEQNVARLTERTIGAGENH